jgi:bacillithiol biosynthesis deacetylase BshB1
MSQSKHSERVDVLAIGAHPDDVELGCGGTLARLAEGGRSIGILHLTRGEAGTRGTAEERRQEAMRAAEALGSSVFFLDLVDGDLRTDTEAQDELIGVLRRIRPRLVLGPAPSDRHPDHDRAYRLVHEACFYSGVVSRGGEGEPHRPSAAYSYMQHDLFDPTFVVDVTSVWDRKMAALAEYKSQLYQEGEARDEPGTKVASRAYREAVVGRARHFGLLVGAELGEPFWSRLPLSVEDPLSVLPKKLR